MPAIVDLAKKHWMWLAGAGALIVAVLYFRSRQQAPAEAATGAGGGFGAGATGPSAPASNTAGGSSDYQNQLDQLQIAAGKQQLEQSKQLFNLQLGQQGQQNALQNQFQSGVLPSLVAAGQAQLGEQAAEYNTQASYQKQLAGVSADPCPGGSSLRYDPVNGGYTCRGKTSGGILGSVTRIVSGFLGGVQQAAPSIGYNAAQAGAAYEAGQLGFGTYPGAKVVPGGGGTIRAARPQQQQPIGLGGFGFGGGLGTPGIAQSQISLGQFQGSIPRPISQGGSNAFSGLPPASGIG